MEQRTYRTRLYWDGSSEPASRTFASVRDLATGWVNGELGEDLVPERSRTVKLPMGGFIELHAGEAGNEDAGYWRIRVSPDEPTSSGFERIDVAIAHFQGKVELSVYCRTPAHARLPRAPSLIQDLPSKSRWRTGVLELQTKPWILGTTHEVDDLLEVYQDPERQVPIVVAAKDDLSDILDGSYAIELARALAGAALVVSAGFKAASRWRDAVDEWGGLSEGDVRVYVPRSHLDETPPPQYIRRGTLLKSTGQEGAVEVVLERVLDAPSVGTVAGPTFADARSAWVENLMERFQSTKRQPAEGTEDQEAERRELMEFVRDLQARNEDLKDRNATLESKLHARQTLQSTELLDPRVLFQEGFDGSLRTGLMLLHHGCRDVIVHDHAFSAADGVTSSETRNLLSSLACAVMAAREVFDAQEGSLGRPLEKVFREHGVNGYRPDDSDTVKQDPSLLAQRTITHEGEKRTLSQHITVGTRGECIQAYFDLLQEERVLLIGYAGTHLDTGKHR